MATYAVGDIQGCYTPFRRLLDACAFDPGQDRLWLVGDLVNRGPESIEVLRFVRGLGAAAEVVLGNHDLYLLMVAEGFGRRQPDDTLAGVLDAADRDELLSWLRQRPLLRREDPYVLVHAGLLPSWSPGQARGLAAEVEHWLASPDYRLLFTNLWGGEPRAWSDSLAGWERLRVIVNAMTRMRFCSPAGEMDLKAKGPANMAPSGLVPWFDVPGRASAEAVVVCGHWSAIGLRLAPNLLSLDSGCLWGGYLTAVRLEDRAVFQVDCAGSRR